jgi:hypothetical protein
MAEYHDRMGEIIEPKNYRRWLEPGDVHSLPFDLLRPYPEGDMKSWRVSDRVCNTRNNCAELIEPISEDAPKHDKPTKRAKPMKDPSPKMAIGLIHKHKPTLVPIQMHDT